MARIACPECHAETLPRSRLTTRRRREVTCRECGAQSEIVIPGVAYFTVTISTSLIATIISMTWLLWFPLAASGKAPWIAASFAVLIAICVGSDWFLGRIAVAQSLEDPHRRAAQAAGRWYPE